MSYPTKKAPTKRVKRVIMYRPYNCVAMSGNKIVVKLKTVSAKSSRDALITFALKYGHKLRKLSNKKRRKLNITVVKLEGEE